MFAREAALFFSSSYDDIDEHVYALPWPSVKSEVNPFRYVCLFVYISEDLTTKRMLTLGFLVPGFQFHKEHACLSSPPASPLPRFDRNQVRAGRGTRLRYKSTHV